MPIIQGYTSLTSVSPGDSIDFHLNSDPPSLATFTIYRYGDNPVSAGFTQQVNTQPTPAVNAWEGFNWQATYQFTVPTTWPCGLYRVKYNDGTQDIDVMDFVVKSLQAGLTSKILLQICVNTPQAYNGSGGKSLYGFTSV